MSTFDTFMRSAARAAASDRRFAGHRLGLTYAMIGFFRWIDGCLERRRQRRELLALTDEQLKDIGVSRSMAHREATRPFWDSSADR